MTKKYLRSIKMGLSCIELETERDRYKAGYNILMEYFDSLPDTEKDKIDQRLSEVGL